MSFQPQEMSEQTLKKFVDRLVKARKGQAAPTIWPPKRNHCQEEIAQVLGFKNWHEAISSVQKAKNISLHREIDDLYWEKKISTKDDWWQLFTNLEHFSIQSLTIEENSPIQVLSGRKKFFISETVSSREIKLLKEFLKDRTRLDLSQEYLNFDWVNESKRLKINQFFTFNNNNKVQCYLFEVTPSSYLPLEEMLTPSLAQEIYNPHGLVLFIGEARQGKTTLLNGALQSLYVSRDARKIRVLDCGNKDLYLNSGQKPGNSNTSVLTYFTNEFNSFSEVINASLRSNPDVLFIHQIRSFDDLEKVLKASLMGVSIISTMEISGLREFLCKIEQYGLEKDFIEQTKLLLSQDISNRFSSLPHRNYINLNKDDRASFGRHPEEFFKSEILSHHLKSL